MEISVLFFLRNFGAMKQHMRTLYQTLITNILFTKQETIKKAVVFAFIYTDS